MNDQSDIFAERIPINPFEPDKEVSPDRFSGRAPEINELRKTFVYASRGAARNHAIVGERGIGKTSLLNFAERAADGFPDFEGKATPLIVTCSLGACGNVEDVAETILDAIYSSTKVNSALHKQLAEWLRTIESVSVSGFGVSFGNGSSGGPKLAIRFPDLVRDVYNQIESEFSALILVLDETDRIAELKGFPDFIKTTSETLRRKDIDNVAFVISAIPAAWKRMKAHNPSFARIFSISNLASLSREEVDSFLGKSLAKGFPQKRVNERFERLFYDFSEGIPSFFQHFGYYAFEHDTDGEMDQADFYDGLMGTASKPGALEQLEQKFFERLYVELVQSNTYRDILHIMASANDRQVQISDIKTQIQSTEPKQVGSYVGNMVKRGVVKKVEGKKGLYELPNVAFKLFLRLKTIKEERS
jgi:hypothetical protein